MIKPRLMYQMVRSPSTVTVICMPTKICVVKSNVIGAFGFELTRALSRFFHSLSKWESFIFRILLVRNQR